MTRPSRTLKKRLHIICEGEKTEPYYINGYIQAYAKDKASVISVPKVKYNTPVSLVEEAIRLKNSREVTSEDEFWVVYDREAVSKYPNRLHANARQTANANNIKIAFSNICFELWLLQHFGFRNTPYTCCDDLISNSPLKADLAKLGVNGYEKANPHLFSKLLPGVARARTRAIALNKESMLTAPVGVHMPHLLSSYTDIHLLLDAIDEFEP